MPTKILQVLIVICLLFAGLPLQAQGLTKIRLGAPAPSAVVAPIWIPKEAGIYAKYGFDPEVIFFNSGGLALRATLAGDVPVTIGSGSDIVPAVLSGAKAFLVSSYVEKIPLTLVAASEIKQVSQLRGKRVAISRFGSNSDVAMRYVVAKAGLDPQRDVTFLQVGGQSERFAALKSGAVHAALLAPPITLIAQRLNLNVLVDLADTDLEYMYAGIATTKTYLDSHPDSVEKLVKAFVEGVHFAKTNKEAAKRIMAKYVKGSASELEESYQAIIQKVFKVDPTMSLSATQAALTQVAERVPEAKSARPEDFVNTQITNKLKQEKFVANLR